MSFECLVDLPCTIERSQHSERKQLDKVRYCLVHVGT